MTNLIARKSIEIIDFDELLSMAGESGSIKLLTSIGDNIQISSCDAIIQVIT